MVPSVAVVVVVAITATYCRVAVVVMVMVVVMGRVMIHIWIQFLGLSFDPGQTQDYI